MEDKNLKLKFYALYLIASGAQACYFPYLIVYFRDRDLNYIQMGIAFAILPLIGVVCQPLWGYITDKYLSKKLTMIIVMSFSSFSIILLTFTRNYYFILCSIILLSIFITSINPVLDALCVEITSIRGDIQFGRIRLMGSIGYAVIVALTGIVIKYTNVNVPFYMFCILHLICIIIISTIHYKGGHERHKIRVIYIARLFKDPRFVLFIISVLLLNISMGANGSYIGELVKLTGGDVSNLGLLWFIIAMSEVPLFFLGNRIQRRFEDLKLYHVCIIFYCIRFFLDSFCTNWKWVIAVQLMQSITFPLYIISNLHFLSRTIAPEMITSGITLYSALGSGLGGFIGNIGGGVILQALGIGWLYRILSLICISALAVGLFIEKKSAANCGRLF